MSIVYYSILFIFILLGGLIPSRCDAEENNRPSELTLLVYASYDADLLGLGEQTVFEIIDAIEGNEYLSAIVLFDRYNPNHASSDRTSTRHIYSRGKLLNDWSIFWSGDELDEVDLGSPGFVEEQLFAPLNDTILQSELAAHEYGIIVLGHSSSWLPAFHNRIREDGSIIKNPLELSGLIGSDYHGTYRIEEGSRTRRVTGLSVGELAELTKRHVPQSKNNFDHVTFFSCNMGNLSVLYELRNSFGKILASAGRVGLTDPSYRISSQLDFTDLHPIARLFANRENEMPPVPSGGPRFSDLALIRPGFSYEDLVSKWLGASGREENERNNAHELGWIWVDTSKLDQFADSMRRFFRTLTPWISDDYQTWVKIIDENVLSPTYGDIYSNAFVNLVPFLENLKDQTSESSVRSSAKTVLDILSGKDSPIALSTSSNQNPDLSMFLPREQFFTQIDLYDRDDPQFLFYDILLPYWKNESSWAEDSGLLELIEEYVKLYQTSIDSSSKPKRTKTQRILDRYDW